jgi:hypothetical protein
MAAVIVAQFGAVLNIFAGGGFWLQTGRLIGRVFTKPEVPGEET